MISARTFYDMLILWYVLLCYTRSQMYYCMTARGYSYCIVPPPRYCTPFSLLELRYDVRNCLSCSYRPRDNSLISFTKLRSRALSGPSTASHSSSTIHHHARSTEQTQTKVKDQEGPRPASERFSDSYGTRSSTHSMSHFASGRGDPMLENRNARIPHRNSL